MSVRAENVSRNKHFCGVANANFLMSGKKMHFATGQQSNKVILNQSHQLRSHMKLLNSIKLKSAMEKHRLSHSFSRLSSSEVTLLPNEQRQNRI